MDTGEMAESMYVFDSVFDEVAAAHRSHCVMESGVFATVHARVPEYPKALALTAEAARVYCEPFQQKRVELPGISALPFRNQTRFPLSR
jgi:hypothetical protein